MHPCFVGIDLEALWIPLFNPNTASCTDEDCQDHLFWSTGNSYGQPTGRTSVIKLQHVIDEKCVAMTKNSDIMLKMSCSEQASSLCEFDCTDNGIISEYIEDKQY